MARVIGLTGVIGSGKSTVAQILREKGAYVIDADEVAHYVILPGKPAYREIVRTFGEEVLNPDGSVNRKLLAEIAFTSKEMREKLNSITHPRVGEEMMRRLKDASQKHDRIVLDVPLLFESGLEQWLRPVVVVYAPESVCIQRIVERDGVSLHHALQRLKAQMSIEEKKKRADFVIDNSGTVEETRRQVEKFWNKIWDFQQGLII